MMIDKEGIDNVENFSHQFMDDYLLNQELHGVNDIVKRMLHRRDNQGLDLLMGVQGWRRFVYQNTTSEIRKEVLGEYCSPHHSYLVNRGNGMRVFSRRRVGLMRSARGRDGEERMMMMMANRRFFMEIGETGYSKKSLFIERMISYIDKPMAVREEIEEEAVEDRMESVQNSPEVAVNQERVIEGIREYACYDEDDDIYNNLLYTLFWNCVVLL